MVSLSQRVVDYITIKVGKVKINNVVVDIRSIRVEYQEEDGTIGNLFIPIRFVEIG